MFQRKKINKEEDLLGCEVYSGFPQIQEIIDAKEPFDKLWRALVTFQDKQEMWLAGPILTLNAEEIEEQVLHFTVDRLKSWKLVFLSSDFVDFPSFANLSSLPPIVEQMYHIW